MGNAKIPISPVRFTGVFSFSPRFELPVKDETGDKKSMINIVCHYCNQPGHKASSCPSNPHKENFKVVLLVIV